jgi:hypothetical protein
VNRNKTKIVLMKKVHLKADLSDQQKANQIVKLNIGGFLFLVLFLFFVFFFFVSFFFFFFFPVLLFQGVKYLTTEQTLCGGRENFFSGLLSGNLPALRDDDGFFFVDRNGELFRYVLEFLRTGRLKVPSELLDDVHAEAAFYSVDLRDFSLSDVALARWLDERQTMVVMQQWVKYPELEEIKVDEVLLLVLLSDFDWFFFLKKRKRCSARFVTRHNTETDLSILSCTLKCRLKGQCRDSLLN